MEAEQLEQQNKELSQHLGVLTELNKLEDATYYRKQLLIMLERIAIAQEKTCELLEEDNE